MHENWKVSKIVCKELQVSSTEISGVYWKLGGQRVCQIEKYWKHGPILNMERNKIQKMEMSFEFSKYS